MKSEQAYLTESSREFNQNLKTMAEEGNISSEIFNETGILNETDIYNGWVNGNDEIYWTVLLTSALIAIVGIGWLASSFGAMCSIIQDLFCG